MAEKGYKELFQRLLRQIKISGVKLRRSLSAQENRISLYTILVIFVGTLVFFIFFSLFSQKPETSTASKQEEVSASPKQEETQVIVKEQELTHQPKANAELASLIQKANILYENGRVNDALEVFEKIAVFSQSLAGYNLGVIKILEKKYNEAIEAFNQSIATEDDVSLSAIDAAYSANRLGNEKLFKHYAEVADSKLAETYGAPFYSYLYGVVSYYKNQYFDALSPLLNPSSQDFVKPSGQLAAEMFLMFNDDYSALEILKKSASKEDSLALGMLYARVGDYPKAKEWIRKYIDAYPQDHQALWALELVDLKNRNFSSASDMLNRLVIEKQTTSPFPIVVGLNDELFDINLAQKNFWNRRFEHRYSLQYKILFYYAPYRVFNIEEVFDILNEGGLNSGINLMEQSVDSYVRSKSISKINRDIALGIKEVYSGDLRSALKTFTQNADAYPQHSVFQYNTGLIYAQFGDFEKAYSYFNRAYYLDNKNILAGVFAIMTGQLLYEDTTRIANTLSIDFQTLEFPDPNERQFLYELFGFVTNKTLGSLEWFSEGYNAKPIYYAFNAVNAMGGRDPKKIAEAFAKLKAKYPNDLTTEVMFQIAKNYGKDMKEVSLEFSTAFRSGEFSNLHSLYYGGGLARELYIYLAFVTGNLPYVISQLQDQLVVEEKTTNGVMQALGLAYIYNREFEKAFVVYNNLVDDLGETDARTKFLGSVAAIGAGHYNNAVALLQISKIDSIASFESRYALALLYQQIGNFKSAIKLFSSLRDQGFTSEFFDFEIDTSEVIDRAENPEKYTQK